MRTFTNFLRKFSIVVSLIILIFETGCTKETRTLVLNKSDTLSFTGTFRFIDSTANSGTVSLRTSENFYDCLTGLPYGHGAGKLLIDDSSIDFVDTLFFITPAIWGPSFVLSGKYSYEFDGQLLTIKTNKEDYNLIYDLRLNK